MRYGKAFIFLFFLISLPYSSCLAEKKQQSQSGIHNLSQVEKLDKYYEKLLLCRAELDEIIKQCLQVISDLKYMQEDLRSEHKKALLQAHAAWKHLMERDSKLIEYIYHGGSGTGIFIVKYEITQTAERIRELEKLFDLNPE